MKFRLVESRPCLAELTWSCSTTLKCCRAIDQLQLFNFVGCTDVLGFYWAHAILNEWMNLNEFYNLYPARETRGSSPGVYSPAVDGNYSIRQWQSGKDVGNYSTSRVVKTWRILSQVITCEFCCFSQRALHGVHNPCSRRSVVRWGGHMRCPCAFCLCLAGRVSFSTRAPVQSLTTANQRRT